MTDFRGWIKLHRKIVEWEWYDDHNTTRLFLHILLTVNFENRKWRGQVVKRGQLLTSLASLSVGIGLSVQQIRTSLKKLKSTHDVTIESTKKFTLISVQNFEKYQEVDHQSNTACNNEITDNQHSNNIKVTTTKECKERKERKEEGEDVITPGGVNDPPIEKEDVDNATFDTWNRFADQCQLPKVDPRGRNARRRSGIRARKQETGFDLAEILSGIEKSPFLCGKNTRKWKADFDFVFLSPHNWVKIVEGKYLGNLNQDDLQGFKSLEEKKDHEALDAVFDWALLSWSENLGNTKQAFQSFSKVVQAEQIETFKAKFKAYFDAVIVVDDPDDKLWVMEEKLPCFEDWMENTLPGLMDMVAVKETVCV